MLENYTKIFDEIKRQIVLITDDDVFVIGKDFMRIKIETDDVLPYNEQINVQVCVIAIAVFLKKLGYIIHKLHYMAALMIIKIVIINCLFLFVNLLNSPTV